jgi:molybdopterin converting factor subunit 1
MRVTIQLFAVLRERAGVAAVELDLPADATAGDVTRAVGERFPAVRDLLARTAVAVNRAYAAPDATVRDGDEVALIPPVSGG